MDRDSEDSATTSSRMAWMLGGAALGALAMYLSDPERGRQRRAMATDKLRSAAAKTSDAFDAASRDIGNRMQGLRAQATRMLARRNMPAGDRMLADRVQQKIGRAVSHPGAIDIDAQQGCITLSGPVLAHEKKQLLDAVRDVPGVREVQDRLQAHERAEDMPELQGDGSAHGSMMQQEWSPGLRAAALIGGGVLGTVGLRRNMPANLLLATAGLALMARGMSNMPLARMTEMRAARQTIDLQKTIHIDAPPERVFDFWSNYENFPRFMTNVQQVRDLGNGRSHWVVKGPAGTQVEWDSELTESRRPEVLAWRSAPDATVSNSGMVRFEPDRNGTRISVQMSYSPPGGALGHAVASMFGRAPKQQMDDDLMRMKAFIETGNTPHDAAQAGQQPPVTLH